MRPGCTRPPWARHGRTCILAKMAYRGPMDVVPRIRPLGFPRRGFTLIEMMATTTIIAILVAIALPIYQNYVMQGRRADAETALSGDAQSLSTCYAQTYDYTSSLCPTLATQSASGFYAITTQISKNQFVLTATPQGIQAGDTTCAQFTIDNTGVRAAQNASGQDETGVCW